MNTNFEKIVSAATEFYLTPLKLFFEEKEPESYFSYEGFEISDFRGVKTVRIEFSKNELVLLLGLNESGKTSILKAIETFDYNNDPKDERLFKQFFTSIRNKQDIECSTPTTLTAEISFSKKLPEDFFKKAIKSSELTKDASLEAASFIKRINERKSVKISRVIPFSNGNPGKCYYQFEDEKPFSTSDLEAILAQEIVRRCPFILYFEDFQDAIPEKIYTNPRSEAFNSAWFEIIDGLFYHTDNKYSIKKFLQYYSPSNRREDDARTVLKKVNATLKETFTKKWQDLSGVNDIDDAEIAFQETKKYFEIKIFEKDGTTYSVHERSKGAVWYLAFLMKTEFRRKKLREASGKPIYLIDEPASNLHSTAQQKMAEDFSKLVEDTTLIYTTHSQYLISPGNVKNIFVVQREEGEVECTRWSDYIQGREAQISYYQPLYDCLHIVPTNFDIPWNKAVITEGPSDALILEIMDKLLGNKHDHVYYPGSSASNLDTLISLNLGWGAKFVVLLDSDKEGKRQKSRYLKKFGLDDDKFVLLPEEIKKIEGMFSEKEKKELASAVLKTVGKSPSKDELLAIFRAIYSNYTKFEEVLESCVSAATKKRFKTLLEKLKA